MFTHFFHWRVRGRLPVVLQTETTECGLACLAMVGSYHGHDIDLASLRHRFPASPRGSTLPDLIRVGECLSLSSRPIKLELNDLARLTCPAILHWDMNHFVVLRSVQGDKLRIHDPAHGERRISIVEASKHFTGVALELFPHAHFTPRREQQRLSLKQLFGAVAGWRSALAKVLALALALEVFGLTSPLFAQWVVDNAVASEDRALLTVLAVGFLCLVVIQAVVTAIRAWVLMALSAQLNVQMLGRLFQHLLQLPMAFFVRRHLADVVSRFDSLTHIQQTLTSGFAEALIDGVMALTLLTMMLFYSPALAGIVCIASAIYAALRIALFRPLRAAEEDHIVRRAKQQSHLLESVRGMQSVKLLNGQTERLGRFQNLTVEEINAATRSQRLAIVFRALNGILFGVENIFVVWFGAKLILAGEFSIGMLFAFVAYKQIFTTRIVNVIEKGVDFSMLGLHSERVADIALSAPEQDGRMATVAGVVPMRFDIELRQVSYRYADNEPFVLQHFNCHIREGESVAIVGPSGCGKSTLVNIMLGLLAPDSGEVLVGGLALRRVDTRHFRSLVGTVMQDDQLFAGSIADNIGFFDPQIDHVWMQHCAQMAAIHEDIAAMPMAYHTTIGDMGSVLSGGQKQRLLLARALYRRPKILVLDEATSHLDVAREQSVNQAIRGLKLTRVIIAHRAETIASADRVIELGATNPIFEMSQTANVAHGG